jgi:hypothetical protein
MKEQYISAYQSGVSEALQEKIFTVFLCGPSIRDLKKPSASLRKLLKDELEKKAFAVVLGEDEGLEEVQNDTGADAQTNELLFLDKHADAVVLIADSPGSFSELGLFSHCHSQSTRKYTFILIINQSYQPPDCYVSLGPVRVVDSNGKVIFANLTDGETDHNGVIKAVCDILCQNRFKSLLK